MRELVSNMRVDEAWDELHAASAGLVRRPSLASRHGGHWAMYAFDTTEKAEIGRRSREWTAVGRTEVECLVEMGRCLADISEGRVPT